MQLVGVGRMAAFETYVDLTLVGAEAEEADGARFVEGQWCSAEIVKLCTVARATVFKRQFIGDISCIIVGFCRISPVVSGVLVAAETIAYDVYRVTLVRECCCSGRSE